MKALSARDILRVVDQGEGCAPLDRPVVVLSLVEEVEPETVSAWPIGRRDRALLELRQATFGDPLPCIFTCPACQERLETELLVSAFILPTPTSNEPFPVDLGDRTLSCRLPTTADLTWAASTPGDTATLLAQRCTGVPDLGSDTVKVVSEAMAERDPQADIELALTCPDCSASWTAIFDIGTYFWAELEAKADALMAEVHVLARAYHWSENDILAMPPSRRRRYLKMVEGT